MKILLTAFEPFGGERINPAQEVAGCLPDTVGGARIVRLTVPVVYGASIDTVLDAMRREAPGAVVCLGQAGGRRAITPERIAVNLQDSGQRDNAGVLATDRPVYADGDAAFFSTLPVRAMVRAIREAGVPADLSLSAGSFVCNHLMYGVLYHIRRSFPGMLGGFVHLPYLDSQVKDRPGVPSLSLQQMTRGVEAALAAVEEELKKGESA